jgi:hypothetical protein
LFRDFVEQSQTLGLELGSADDCGVHDFIIPQYVVI